MKWFRRRQHDPIVLGIQMAAAISAEQAHQRRPLKESPLSGVAYDAGLGEYDLFRLATTATDDRIATVALAAYELDTDGLGSYRDSLGQDDLYTLLAFARRVTVRALRGDLDVLSAGWAAIAIVDVERVDWRDAAVAASLLAGGSVRSGADLKALKERAVALCNPRMAKILRDHATALPNGISDAGYREIPTADGPALVEDYGEPFAPNGDLLAIAAAVSDVVDSERYRVTGITTGTDIAPVWLPAMDRAKAQTILERVQGCVSISGAPTNAAASTFPEQSLLIHVAECASPADAAALAGAAYQPQGSGIAEIAISSGSVCLIAIGRSTVVGVDPIETTASLERFRTRFSDAVASDPA